jgi:dihydroneopterin aldolase
MTEQHRDMDRVSLKGMAFYAFHGTSREEQTTGRHYEVDCDCWLDTRKSADTDRISQTIDYSTIYERTAAIIKGTPVTLIETVAEQIAASILSSSQVIAVNVCVRKLHPPINGQVAAAEVEIYRTR